MLLSQPLHSLLPKHKFRPRGQDPLDDLRLLSLAITRPRRIHQDVRDRQEGAAQTEALAPTSLDDQEGVARREAHMHRPFQRVQVGDLIARAARPGVLRYLRLDHQRRSAALQDGRASDKLARVVLGEDAKEGSPALGGIS